MSYPQDISFAYALWSRGMLPLDPLKEKGVTMKEKYFVIGFRRYKTQEEFRNRVVGHNHRQRHYTKSHSNIDWERTPDNIILTPLQFKNLDELKQYAKSNLAKGKRNLKKGAAWGFDMIVDCTPRKDWTKEDYICYLKEAEAWLRKRFRGLKVISSVIHLDEGKPHLHIVFSYFNEIEGQWYQRKLKELGVDRLPQLLDDFKKDIGKKFGFVRGKGKKLNKPLKKELAKKVKEVEIKKGLLSSEKKKVIFAADAVSLVKDLDAKYKKAIYENEHLKEELIKARKEKEELERRLKELQEKAKEIEALKQENKILKEKNIILVKKYDEALRIAVQERAKRYQREVSREFLREMIDKQIQREL